ncbi:hypothetical protein UU7_14790 [Rhodanobacter spathiphylli B39]|uniref:YggT family protein n=1 Tax=Rhodanobacter spathiphylli B39 TaxID=1163407 RepID=I4VUT6_9GAMM|nr:hypothetical protein UU7_14790 [Rhodanobacter spathiphylli B39]
MSYLLNALSMLIELVFEAAVTLLLLRVAAEACRADFHNPLSQFIYRYTNPVLAPIRRVLPNWRRINLAALLLAWLAMLLKPAAVRPARGDAEPARPDRAGAGRTARLHPAVLSGADLRLVPAEHVLGGSAPSVAQTGRNPGGTAAAPVARQAGRRADRLRADGGDDRVAAGAPADRRTAAGSGGAVGTGRLRFPLRL